MSSDQKIADIKRQLGEAVNRIESIQGGRQQPLLSKISNHFRAQGGSIVNVVLTASVFAVAFGRLQQKQQHESEKNDWQENQQKLQLDRDRLSEQVSGLERQLIQLKAGVQRELNDGGYRLGPVKSRLQEMLEDFATASSSTPSQQSQKPNMPPLPVMTQQPASLLHTSQPERFTSLITGFDVVVDTCRRMVAGARALDMPILVTEQYPKALGGTKQLIKGSLPTGMQAHPKLLFSMCGDDTAGWWAKHSEIRQVLLCGIEAHVCVLQTALDLLDRGIEVHLVVDGISSQRLVDRQVALKRVSQSGAFLGTSEMLLFQLMQGAKHPAFKTISTLFKEKRADSPLPGKL